MDTSEQDSATPFTAERQASILALLKEQGRVEVLEVARLMQVSEHTVRRDLLALQKQGVLQRTHGGAIALDTVRADLPTRAGVAPQAKAAIGRAAVALIKPGQTLILDAGSTNLAFAQALVQASGVRPLTVITNSLDIAQVFTGDPQVQLMLTGGSWQPDSRALWGPAAEAMLQHCRADWAVPGACALHAEQGVTASDEADAALKRLMVSRSLKTLVLGDKSKQGGVGPFLVAEWGSVDTLVTDQAWPELAVRGVKLVLAEP
ncbi:MAG TPA: DeoR/GlpR family DNA-binding transcription regulator [Ideonella sp.]|nr:DeoR/GlpR family DNA-binding transcription regulator [Ideonella sp.]